MKKGQMEIMGLVVIVLLITIGMFFIIRFVIFSEDDDVFQGYTQTQTAANLLSTMRRTTTACDSLSFEQLLQTCVTNSQKSCPGMRVCDYVEDEVKLILDETLTAWGNKPYRFKAYLSQNDMIIEYGPMDGQEYVCGADDPGDLKQEFVPTSAGLVTLELKICDR